MLQDRYAIEWMQRAPFGISEVITLVVCDQIDDGSLGQRRGLIEDEPALFNACAESGHEPTVRVPK